MGADGELLENSILYGRIILLALPFYILQYEFQCLFSVAEKPRLGLYVTVAAGLTNMVLDALLVAVFHYGLAGAAAATAISQFHWILRGRRSNFQLPLRRAKQHGTEKPTPEKSLTHQHIFRADAGSRAVAGTPTIPYFRGL